MERDDVEMVIHAPEISQHGQFPGVLAAYVQHLAELVKVGFVLIHLFVVHVRYFFSPRPRPTFPEGTYSVDLGGAADVPCRPLADTQGRVPWIQGSRFFA